MITCNGILGLSLLLGAWRSGLTVFNAEGTGAALATVATLATLSLALPTFTTARPGPEFSPAQLTFAATASLALYGMFVLTQTVRHRDFFLPLAPDRSVLPPDEHASPPTTGTALTSLGFLLVALVAVVGLAKVESPIIEDAVGSLGYPRSFVGVPACPPWAAGRSRGYGIPRRWARAGLLRGARGLADATALLKTAVNGSPERR